MTKNTGNFPRLLARAGLWLLTLGLVVTTANAQTTATGLSTLDGREVEATEIDQGAVVIFFWASWSPRCRDIVERVNAIDRRWGERARIVMVNFQEDPGKVKAFLAGKNARAASYLDRGGRFSKDHAITFLPGLLILVDGQITFRGKLPAKPDDVLRSALAG